MGNILVNTGYAGIIDEFRGGLQGLQPAFGRRIFCPSFSFFEFVILLSLCPYLSFCFSLSFCLFVLLWGCPKKQKKRFFKNIFRVATPFPHQMMDKSSHERLHCTPSQLLSKILFYLWGCRSIYRYILGDAHTHILITIEKEMMLGGRFINRKEDFRLNPPLSIAMGSEKVLIYVS